MEKIMERTAYLQLSRKLYYSLLIVFLTLLVFLAVICTVNSLQLRSVRRELGEVKRIALEAKEHAESADWMASDILERMESW